MIELQLITAHYGDRKAQRSGIPLINHIHEGLRILRHIGATNNAQRAWCLHPLVQAGDDLERTLRTVDFTDCSPRATILAMVYRERANEWLSNQVYRLDDGRIEAHGTPNPGAITEVRHMLIADKVQNYKDFLRHQTDHPRRKELDVYFIAWLTALSIDRNSFLTLSHVCEAPPEVPLWEHSPHPSEFVPRS